MSKPVGAVAIMKLIEDKKLAFSDPLSKYLPEWAGAEGGRKEGRKGGREGGSEGGRMCGMPCREEEGEGRERERVREGGNEVR
jgi:hypothetical protein